MSIDPQQQPDRLYKLEQMLAHTREEELDCDECLERVDRFAEEVLAGKDACEAMPLVEEHLQRCDDCREEFEALLAALRAQQQ